MIRKFTFILFSFFLLITSPLRTYAVEDEQELATFYPNQILKVDIDSDDFDESISLLMADVDGDLGNQVYIVKVTDDDDYVSTKAELIDGWNLVYLFTVEIYPTLPPYIAVGYTYQGEIPYSIDLFRYIDDIPSFGNLKRIAHFESDTGSILLKGVDGDDIKEIVVKNKAGDVTYKYIDDDKWTKVSSHKTAMKEKLPKIKDNSKADIELIKAYESSMRFGMAWRKMTLEQKKHYLIGYEDGALHTIGYYLSGDKEANDAAVQALPSFEAGLSNDQLIKKLDVYYENLGNLTISIPLAIRIITNDIRGVEDDVANEMKYFHLEELKAVMKK